MVDRLVTGCLENDDLENDDPKKQFWKIIVKQKKMEKKSEQRTFKREKGDTWREVWLEVNRVSLQAISPCSFISLLFLRQETLFWYPYLFCMQEMIISTFLNQHHGIKFFGEKILINVL